MTPFLRRVPPPPPSQSRDSILLSIPLPHEKELTNFPPLFADDRRHLPSILLLQTVLIHSVSYHCLKPGSVEVLLKAPTGGLYFSQYFFRSPPTPPHMQIGLLTPERILQGICLYRPGPRRDYKTRRLETPVKLRDVSCPGLSAAAAAAAYIAISINSLELEVLPAPIPSTICKTEYRKSLQNMLDRSQYLFRDLKHCMRPMLLP